jgi:hypothetical protein
VKGSSEPDDGSGWTKRSILNALRDQHPRELCAAQLARALAGGAAPTLDLVESTTHVLIVMTREGAIRARVEEDADGRLQQTVYSLPEESL